MTRALRKLRSGDVGESAARFVDARLDMVLVGQLDHHQMTTNLEARHDPGARGTRSCGSASVAA
jgi:hypothetical protein